MARVAGKSWVVTLHPMLNRGRAPSPNRIRREGAHSSNCRSSDGYASGSTPDRGGSRTHALTPAHRCSDANEYRKVENTLHCAGTRRYMPRLKLQAEGSTCVVSAGKGAQMAFSSASCGCTPASAPDICTFFPTAREAVVVLDSERCRMPAEELLHSRGWAC